MKQRLVLASVAVGLALVVGTFRFLAIDGFSNDHYMHLSASQQIAMGEWPSRDFLEMGIPLMEVVSAVPFWVVPDAPLFGEALLVAVMFGLAAVFALYAARRLTGSLWIALIVVALEVLIFPRTYSYPKILAYAAGFLMMWRYVERPSQSRMVQLALTVAVAFLLRYDHGVYLGVGGLLTVVGRSMPASRMDVAKKAAAFAGVVFLFLAPYLVSVAVYDGLWRHISRGLELQAVENDRGRTIPEFSLEGDFLSANAVAWLFFFFHVLPLVAAAVAWMRWRALDAHQRLMVVPLIVVAVLVNVGLIRDTVSARLPDAVVPISMLLGWLVASASRVRAWPGRGLAWVAATAVVVMTVASATTMSATREQLEKAEMLGGLGRLWRHVHSRAAQLHERFPPSQMPSRLASALMPFFRYADRCLDTRDHILITAYAPEVTVWSRRPFAGGRNWFQPELLRTDRDYQEVLSRLHAQRVPVTILVSPSSERVVGQSPDLSRYVRDHFPDRTVLATDDGRDITIGFDPRLAVGRDHETGWLCYR